MLRNRTACVKSNHVDHFQKGNIGHTVDGRKCSHFLANYN